MKPTRSLLLFGAALMFGLVSPAARGGTVAPAADELGRAVVPFPVAQWTALLARHVDDAGRVRYADIDRREVERLYAAVAASSPAATPDAYPTPAAREAYYLDAYNVLVWKNVLDRLPKLKSVNDEKVSFFYFTKFVVGKKAINLKDLEGEIIRPQFKDPRVHMALNCASAGCPELPREAFVADRLDAQLDRETRKFIADKRNVALDGKTLRLSQIFDWYKGDFGKDPAKVIAWINRYRAPDAQLPTDARIAYIEYDWRLNDEHLAR